MPRAQRIKDEAEKTAIVLYLKEKTAPSRLTSNAKQNFVRLASQFVNEQGVLLLIKGDNKLRFFADYEASDKELFIAAAHGHSHIGTRKMESLIFDNASGTSRKEIREYVSNCRVCQASTPYNTLPSIRPIVEVAKMEWLIADAVDMRAYSEHNDGVIWILNIVDA
ncbi:hypothetical protein ENBRE01_3159 [Enteropsectra breve]|nr:hypothetical protein ENBRE01_3159 [Enteropsectra breve]